MASIPPFSRFPSWSNPSRVSPVHFVAVASALRLGHILQLHCGHHLHLFECSTFQEGYSAHLSITKDLWCQRPYLVKKFSSIEKLADAFSAACSSCFSYFGGKDAKKEFMDKGKLPFNASEGRSFDGRLWTNVLLGLNVLVYVAQVATQGKLILLGAKVNSLIDRGQLWRLVTSSFLHANVGHLLVNCYSLNSIGPAVELISGPRRFLAVYFTSAISSSLFSYNFCDSPAVGASGAIFGLVGSFAVFVLRHRSLFGSGKQDILQIARVIALNMVVGLLSRGIDNWGHLGGLLGGAAISWFLGPAWRFQSKSDDGSLVFADRAPIFHLLNTKRLR